LVYFCRDLSVPLMTKHAKSANFLSSPHPVGFSDKTQPAIIVPDDFRLSGLLDKCF